MNEAVQGFVAFYDGKGALEDERWAREAPRISEVMGGEGGNPGGSMEQPQLLKGGVEVALKPSVARGVVVVDAALVRPDDAPPPSREDVEPPAPREEVEDRALRGQSILTGGGEFSPMPELGKDSGRTPPCPRGAVGRMKAP